MISDLSQRLAEIETELAAENEKMDRGERVRARVAGMLERGQIGGLDAARMMDGDFGDAHRAEQLERRRESLQRRLAEAQAMISPEPERAPDQFSAANRAAHQLFIETTRQRMADVQAGRLQRRERPFGSVSRGAGQAVRSESCVYCTQAGVSDEVSYLLHSDPELAVPVTLPDQAAQQAEAARLRRLGYSAETAQYAAVPAGAEIAR
jgi:hypothetical protein